MQLPTTRNCTGTQSPASGWLETGFDYEELVLLQPFGAGGWSIFVEGVALAPE